MGDTDQQKLQLSEFLALRFAQVYSTPHLAQLLFLQTDLDGRSISCNPDSLSAFEFVFRQACPSQINRLILQFEAQNPNHHELAATTQAGLRLASLPANSGLREADSFTRQVFQLSRQIASLAGFWEIPRCFMTVLRNPSLPAHTPREHSFYLALREAGPEGAASFLRLLQSHLAKKSALPDSTFAGFFQAVAQMAEQGWHATEKLPADHKVREARLREIESLDDLHLPSRDLEMLLRLIRIPALDLKSLSEHSQESLYFELFSSLPIKQLARFFNLLPAVTGDTRWQRQADHLKLEYELDGEVFEQDLAQLASAQRFLPEGSTPVFSMHSSEELRAAQITGVDSAELDPQFHPAYKSHQILASLLASPPLHPRTYFRKIAINGVAHPPSVLIPVQDGISRNLTGLENRQTAADWSCHAFTLLLTRPSELKRILDPFYIADYLRSYYTEKALDEPRQLWDIGLIFKGRNLLHSFVFLSDSLVLNKDALGESNPALLRPSEEVLHDWQVGHGTTLRVYRNQIPDRFQGPATL